MEVTDKQGLLGVCTEVDRGCVYVPSKVDLKTKITY